MTRKRQPKGLDIPIIRNVIDRVVEEAAVEPGMVGNPLMPSMPLLCKLGSIIVHADEYTSPTGCHIDKVALRALLDDDEVQHWMAKMGVYLPVKR